MSKLIRARLNAKADLIDARANLINARANLVDGFMVYSISFCVMGDIRVVVLPMTEL